MLTMYALERGGGYALRSLMPLLSVEAPKQWIHVAYVGEWKGHAAGEFALTREAFAEIERNFHLLGNPIPLDYEHQTVTGAEAPAAGWIRDIRVTGQDLWAFVEFTDRAANMVKAGEYKFCSGVFEFSARDPKSGDEIGTVMSSIALTNAPFIRGQKPIELSQRVAASAATTRSDMDISKLTKILDLADDATDAQVKARVEAFLKWRAATEDAADDVAEAAPVPAPAAAPAAAAATSQTVAAADPPAEGELAPGGGLLDQIMALLQGLDDASLQAILEQLSGAGAATAEATAVKAATDQIAALSARVAAAEKKAKEASDALVKQEVAHHVERGQIADSAKATATELALKDRALFEKIYLTGTPPVKTGRVVPPEPAPGTPANPETVALSDGDKAEVAAIEKTLSHVRNPERRRAIALSSYLKHRNAIQTA